MSADQTPVDDALRAYIKQRCDREDPLLSELRAAATEAGIPAIQISPEQARLMQALLRLKPARRILEVGTLAGYSAINMGRALPEDGQLISVEADPERARFARSWIERAGLSERITVREGRGQDVLPELEDHSFDAAFFDADKTGLPQYIEDSARLLRPGGLLMIDNAFAFGQLLDASVEDPDVDAIRRANDQLARDERFTACLVAIGDGLWVGTRR